MEIITGRAISKSVIKKLLKPVPKYILKQINKIVVSVVPDKKFKEIHRSWGGYWGNTDEKNKIVYIYLYSIAESTNQSFKDYNNNWYHKAVDSLADTLYWQIGVIDNHYKKKNTARSSVELFSLKTKKKAEKLGLLEPPSPKKIRFFKIWRDKMIDRQMTNLRRNDEFDSHYLPVIDHLRKTKIGLKYKYNTCQLFTTMFGLSNYRYKEILWDIYKKAKIHLNSNALDDYTWKEGNRLYRKDIRKFKGLTLKIVKPKYYISKKGLHYPFFTEKNLQRLKKKIKWKPVVEDAYVRNDNIGN